MLLVSVVVFTYKTCVFIENFKLWLYTHFKTLSDPHKQLFNSYTNNKIYNLTGLYLAYQIDGFIDLSQKTCTLDVINKRQIGCFNQLSIHLETEFSELYKKQQQCRF